MNFGLLLSDLPHARDSRGKYDAMLALHVREPRRLAAVCQILLLLLLA
jgi:hypothetical protein